MRALVGATCRNLNAEGRPVQLRFLGKETTGGQSPTLYATDQDSYVVQGWIVSEPDVLAHLDVAEDETVVEVYSRLLNHLEKDGLSGEVVSDRHPIVHVTERGTYVLQGKQLVDEDTMAQMDIPDHETAIEVPRNVMAALVEGR
jgi:hypothetical protein